MDLTNGQQVTNVKLSMIGFHFWMDFKGFYSLLLTDHLSLIYKPHETLKLRLRIFL